MPKYTSSTSLQKPSIGLDLDGVSTKTRPEFLTYIQDWYDITISNDILYGSNPQIPDTDVTYGEAVQVIARENMDVYRTMSPITGAPEATQNLKHKFKINIVTHRVSEGWLDPEKRSAIRDISQDWLNTNGFHYDNFVYPTPQNKGSTGDEVYIDDRASNLASLSSNTEGILFLRPHTKRIPDYIMSAADLSKYTESELKDNPQLQWSIISDYLLNNY